MQGSTKFLQLFRSRCDKGENQRWLPAAKFIDESKPFSDDTTRLLGKHLEKNPTSGLGGDAIMRKTITDERTDGRRIVH